MSMKKPAVILFLAMAVLTAGPGPVPAQSRQARKPLQLFVDIGYMNLFDYPKWMFFGPELEIRLGSRLTLNPEVSFWSSQNLRGNIHVIPGATANVRFNRVIAGIGAVGRVPEWADSAGGWLIPKVQVGYLTGPARLTLSCLYLSEVQQPVLGLTISVGIGRRPRGPED